ncbi:transposase [Salipaludibacillus sp. HK11]|uniref:transposase n=1 Tax=Salipaludibacillus sp. HK11 TaxID=3394320 RepID=UPI0039FBE1D5
MSILRQESLLSIDVLYDLEPTQRYDELFSTLTTGPIVLMVLKKSRLGRPVKLNYPAMIQSLIIRYVERISEVKLLVKRLKDDIQFKRDCGFGVADAIPSEASYSRMVSEIKASSVLKDINHQLVHEAIDDGYISDFNVAIDATHIEAKDKAPSKEKKDDTPKPEPKKRGCKNKEEQSAWLKEKEEFEASLPVYKKKIEDQLDIPFDNLEDEIPLGPEWGIKKNSDGKNVFWYGFKGHIAVETKSQFILESLMSSGNLNDGKAAIPLLKGIQTHFPHFQMKHVTMDAGYDYPAIYEQVHRMKGYSIIAYNKRNEPEPLGFDKHFAPTCVREHSYRYDSFDKKYQTLKFTQPKECGECPLAHDSLCQKVFKIKMDTDLRKYSAPARGTESWKTIYKERSSSERVIAYLKEQFQLNNIRYRTGERAKVHFDFTTLVYNAMKLAGLRLKTKRSQGQKAA